MQFVSSLIRVEIEMFTLSTIFSRGILWHFHSISTLSRIHSATDGDDNTQYDNGCIYSKFCCVQVKSKVKLHWHISHCLRLQYSKIRQQIILQSSSYFQLKRVRKFASLESLFSLSNFRPLVFGFLFHLY